LSINVLGPYRSLSLRFGFCHRMIDKSNRTMAIEGLFFINYFSLCSNSKKQESS